MDGRSGQGSAGGARRRSGGGRRRLYRRLAGAVAIVMLLGAAPVVIEASTASGQGGLVRIGAAPRLPRGAVDLGPAPAAASVSGAVVVRPRDGGRSKASSAS